MDDTSLTPLQEARELETLRKALESTGELFPTTEESVLAYEQYLKNNPPVRSSILPNPMEIIRRGRLPFAQVKEEEPLYTGNKRYGMAARNGQEGIPEHIRKKMDQQRREDEKNKPDPDQ